MDLFEFIKQLPMTWDDTKVLEMKIGDYITMVRRSGDTWLTAALADESGREMELKLDFLQPGITYDVTLYEDTAESHYQFPRRWGKKDNLIDSHPEVAKGMSELFEASIKSGRVTSGAAQKNMEDPDWVLPF